MKILGLTDAVNTCDCCGRKNLKRTVAIEAESGDLMHFGTTCASNKHLHLSLGEIKKQAQINKDIYCLEIASKAKLLPEYAIKKAIYTEARSKGLKCKLHSDFVRPSTQAFSKSIEDLINGNTINVKLSNILMLVA